MQRTYKYVRELKSSKHIYRHIQVGPGINQHLD